ncbi:MAG: class II aldolase/adducin family protein, partial [Alphaproteobacteria bacterium]|nr:class II aldolase/adducin family protein [Alphaproteobacteria bacterium]
MDEVSALRARVAQACRVLGGLGLTLATTGHASARLPGTDRIFIRARGPAESGVRYTGPDDIIEVGPDGRQTDGSADGASVPIEVHIHTEIYRARPEVNAIVHVHPPTVVLLSICDKPLQPIYGAYDPHSLRLVLDGIPVFESGLLIERPELGKRLAATLGRSPVCLMRGHGITTAANSVEESALLAIHLNEMALMTYRATLLGGAKPIPPEEQAAFRVLPIDQGYGGTERGHPGGRAISLW